MSCKFGRVGGGGGGGGGGGAFQTLKFTSLVLFSLHDCLPCTLSLK